jgi:hypothetical protein
MYLFYKIVIAKAFAFGASTVALYTLFTVSLPPWLVLAGAIIGGAGMGLFGVMLTHFTFYASPGESPGFYRLLRGAAWVVLPGAVAAMMSMSPALGMVGLTVLVQSALAPGVTQRLGPVWRWIRREHVGVRHPSAPVREVPRPAHATS